MQSPAVLERESRRAFDAVKDALALRRWPEIAIRWNRRLRRAGRATIEMPAERFQSAVIELSPAYFAVYPEDLYGILVHEAVHVGLAIQDRPFGHGADFQTACRAAGGLPYSRWLPGRIYVYRCPVCSTEVERRRPIAESRWCATCVDAAEERAQPAFVSDRSLVLVRTEFRGPENTGPPNGRQEEEDTGVTTGTGGQVVCESPRCTAGRAHAAASATLGGPERTPHREPLRVPRAARRQRPVRQPDPPPNRM